MYCGNTSTRFITFGGYDIIILAGQSNAEGSGLGISISKSLVELQRGKFDIVIDGDLFKVILKFQRKMK